VGVHDLLRATRVSSLALLVQQGVKFFYFLVRTE